MKKWKRRSGTNDLNGSTYCRGRNLRIWKQRRRKLLYECHSFFFNEFWFFVTILFHADYSCCCLSKFNPGDIILVVYWGFQMILFLTFWIFSINLSIYWDILFSIFFLSLFIHAKIRDLPHLSLVHLLLGNVFVFRLGVYYA